MSGQGNGGQPILVRGRILEMSQGVATSEFRTTHSERGCNIGLLWRPQPKAPPFGRGFLLKQKATLVRGVVLHAGKARPLNVTDMALPWGWMVLPSEGGADG